MAQRQRSISTQIPSVRQEHSRPFLTQKAMLSSLHAQQVFDRGYEMCANALFSLSVVLRFIGSEPQAQEVDTLVDALIDQTLEDLRKESLRIREIVESNGIETAIGYTSARTVEAQITSPRAIRYLAIIREFDSMLAQMDGLWLSSVVTVTFERSGAGTEPLRDLASNLAFMPLNLLVATLNLLASRHASLDIGVRRALRLLGIGAVMVLIGNLISVSYFFSRGESPGVSWADPFYLPDGGFTLAALLSFPLIRRTRLDGWKFVIDAATVLVGGGLAIWFLAIRPGMDASVTSLTDRALALAYPMAGLLLLLGVTMTLLRRPLDGNRRAFHVLIAGVVLSIVADLTFDLIVAQAGERIMGWIDAVYLIVYILLVASAEMYWAHPVPAGSPAVPGRTRRQPSSLLPYLAVGATYGLLLGVTVQPWVDPVSPIAAAAVAITALVVARQLLTVRENVQLIAEAAARRNEARFRALVQHARRCSSWIARVGPRNGAFRRIGSRRCWRWTNCSWRRCCKPWCSWTGSVA